MKLGAVGIAILFVALIGASVDAGSPARADVESRAPIELRGVLDISGGTARFYAESWALTADVEGNLGGLRATYYSWTFTRAHENGHASATFEAPAVASFHEWPTASVRLDFEREPVTLRAVTNASGFHVTGDAFTNGDLRFVEGSADDSHAGGMPAVRALSSVLAAYPRLATGASDGWFVAGEIDRGIETDRRFPALAAPALAFDGPARVQIQGGNVSIASPEGRVERFRLGEWTDGTWGRAGVLDLSFERASLRLPLGAQWALATPDPALRVAGALEVPEATGVIDGAHVEPTRFRDERLLVEGDFIVSPTRGEREIGSLDAPPTRYRIEGDAVLSLGEDPADLSRLAMVTTGAAASGSLAAFFYGTRGIGFRVLGAFYHRLSSDEALHNRTRREIMDVIRHSPGLHMRALGRATRLTWGRLVFHLDVLERSGYVRLVERGRYRLAFASEVDPERAASVNPLHPIAGAVLAAVRDEGELRAVDLRARLGVSRQRLAYHLRTLESRRLLHVERAPDGHAILSPPTVQEGALDASPDALSGPGPVR